MAYLIGFGIDSSNWMGCYVVYFIEIAKVDHVCETP